MASVPKQKRTSGEKQNNSLLKSNLLFFFIRWHGLRAAWHTVYCKQTLRELRQPAPCSPSYSLSQCGGGPQIREEQESLPPSVPPMLLLQ